MSVRTDGRSPRRDGNTAWTMPARGRQSGKTWTSCPASALALVLLGSYGALGLAGLAHYTLALCSEHTLVANLTIWSEVAAGLLLLLASAVLFVRRLMAGRARPRA